MFEQARTTARLGVLVLVGASALASCGISQPEHYRLVQQALANQRKGLDFEMTRIRDRCERDIAENVERIKQIEGDLYDLGIDVRLAKTDLKDQLLNTKAELEQLRKKRELAERDAQAFRQMVERLKAMIDAGKIHVVTRKGRMTLALPDEVLFPTGSKKLLAGGQETLLTVIDVLRSVEDREFLIAGHTDNVPIKSKRGISSNWDLSTARAVEVVNFMIANGVAPNRLVAAGYGEFDPVADNSTPEGRMRNRRLEIILMPRIEVDVLRAPSPPVAPGPGAGTPDIRVEKREG